MRINEDRRKGYELSSFKDAFKRYIPLTPPISTVTTGQINNINEIDDIQSVTDKNGVTDEKQLNQLELLNCRNVTDEKGGVDKDIIKNDEPLRKRLRFENEQEYLAMINK